MEQNWLEQFHTIAILGGTFNPVHIGHLVIAETILQQAPQIEQLVFMPNHIPAYKEQKKIADGRHRMEMLSLAAKELPRSCVSDLELKREGYTYTVDTLQEIKQHRPGLQIYFVIGDDSLFHLHTWHNFEQLAELCRFLVVAREENKNAVLSYVEQFCTKYPAFSISYVEMEKIPVSSSEIRKRLKLGQSVEGLLPETVAAYIETYNLYKD